MITAIINIYNNVEPKKYWESTGWLLKEVRIKKPQEESRTEVLCSVPQYINVQASPQNIQVKLNRFSLCFSIPLGIPCSSFPSVNCCRGIHYLPICSVYLQCYGRHKSGEQLNTPALFPVHSWPKNSILLLHEGRFTCWGCAFGFQLLQTSVLTACSNTSALAQSALLWGVA